MGWAIPLIIIWVALFGLLVVGLALSKNRSDGNKERDKRP